MSDITDTVKVSDLPRVDYANGEHYFLAIERRDSSSNVYRNVQVGYKALSTDVFNSAVLAAKGDAITYCTGELNATSSFLSTEVKGLITSINNMKKNAGNMTSLTATYLSACNDAALSITALSTLLYNTDTGMLNKISAEAYNKASSYAYNHDLFLSGLMVNLSNDLTGRIHTAGENFNGLSDTVNYVSNNISTSTLLKNRFDYLSDVISDLVDFSNTQPDNDGVKFGPIKLGFNNIVSENKYGVRVNDDGRAYVYVPGGGGGGGGGSDPDGWQEVKEYVLTSLKGAFGILCLKYYNTVDVLSDAIDAITNKFEQKIQYYSDTFSVNDEYHVIVLDNRYSGKDAEYYIVKDQLITEELITVDNPELENKKYIEIVDATTIHVASSIDLSEQKYTDEGGEVHFISQLNKYDIILTPDNIYVVKENGSNKNAETAVVSNACYMIPSLEYAARYIAYIDINYSIVKVVQDFSKLKHNLSNIIIEVVENSIDKFINDYSLVSTFYNTSSIEILPNSTNHIAINIDSIDKFTPIAIKSIAVDNANILTTSASIFNNKVYITLLNNSNSAITLLTNKISSEVLYIRVAV